MPKWFQHKGRQHNDFLHILVNLCCAVCWKRCPLHFGYFTKAHSHSAVCLLSSHTLKPTHTTAFCRELCMCVLCFAFLFYFFEGPLVRKGSVEEENQLTGPSSSWLRSHDDVLTRSLSLSEALISPSDKSSSSCPHVRRECTAMLRSGSLPLCRNQLSRRLTMAFKPILFGVALAAGGASGQVPIAGDTRGPLSQRWPAVPALFVLEAAPTRFLDTTHPPSPPPFFFLLRFFILVAVALPATLAGPHSGENVWSAHEMKK